MAQLIHAYALIRKLHGATIKLLWPTHLYYAVEFMFSMITFVSSSSCCFSPCLMPYEIVVFYVTRSAPWSQKIRLESQRDLDNPQFAIYYGWLHYQHWEKGVRYTLDEPLCLFLVSLKYSQQYCATSTCIHAVFWALTHKLPRRVLLYHDWAIGTTECCQLVCDIISCIKI